MGLKLKDLAQGFKFEATEYLVDRELTLKYLDAVEDSSPVFKALKDGSETGYVPPSAIAALSMKALMQAIELPPGAIHTSQELEFNKAIKTNSTITCLASVLQKQTRGNINIFSLEIKTLDHRGDTILTGKTMIMLPPA